MRLEVGGNVLLDGGKIKGDLFGQFRADVFHNPVVGPICYIKKSVPIILRAWTEAN